MLHVMTVRGRVYPVGDIDRKIFIAQHAGMTRFIYPSGSEMTIPSALPGVGVNNIFDLLRETVVGESLASLHHHRRKGCHCLISPPLPMQCQPDPHPPCHPFALLESRTMVLQLSLLTTALLPPFPLGQVMITWRLLVSQRIVVMANLLVPLLL